LPLLVLAYVVHFGAQSLRTSQVAVAGIPRNVEDAARSLGADRWRRLVRVELPLMRPALLSGAGIVLLSTMKELPATLILAPAGFQTLAMKIWSATESAIFVDASLASLMLILLSGFLTWVLVIRRAEVAP
jgi:iron(III) transport system permease protein